MKFLFMLALGLASAKFTRSRKPPPTPITNVSTVHLVYMTHLDLGYTGTTRAVCSKYFDKDFPAAFNTSQELRRRGGKERFRWTQFPWLIQEYLDGAANCAHGGNRSICNISWQIFKVLFLLWDTKHRNVL